MPVLAVLILALIHLTGATNIGLIIVYTFPVSLILLSGACLLCSLLMTIKSPVLFSNQFDKYAIASGNLVILVAGITMLFSMQTNKAGQTIPAEFAPFIEKAVVYPKNVLDEWEQGVWRNKTPACLRATESTIENNCPGSIDVTFCWQMDPAKDWGTNRLLKYRAKTRALFFAAAIF